MRIYLANVVTLVPQFACSGGRRGVVVRSCVQLVLISLREAEVLVVWPFNGVSLSFRA